MVWEETPGWGYVGADKEFEDQVLQNVCDMVRRDRNHASIIIWGVRVNESHNNPLYIQTTAAAKALDDSRPDSGSMTYFGDWKTTWHEDVFSFDDYHQSRRRNRSDSSAARGHPLHAFRDRRTVHLHGPRL